jgi:hypothetical protein
MKKIACFLVIALAVVTLTAAGCQRPNVVISPAPIHEVRVAILETYPPQVSVYIKGGLPNTCTTFHDLTVKRSGSTINIVVTVQVEKDRLCGQVYTFFERNVNLGSEFISGQTYTINVNGKVTTFVMQ